MSGRETAAITAQDTFTDWVTPKKGGGVASVHLSIYGTFSATVVAQVKVNGAADSTARDLTGESYSVATERIITLADDLVVRAGVKTGGFTSGTVNVELA